MLLDNTIAYTKSLCASLATRWKELAGDAGLLGEDTFLNGDPSIAAQVTRITSLPTKPDLIFFCSYAPGGPSAIRQIARRRHRLPRSSPASRSTATTGSAPCRTSAISTSSTTARNTATIRIRDVNDFFKRFEAKYGKKADVSYGLRGYSAVQAWATAANKAGSLDGDKVAAVLDTFDKEPLVIGPTT